MDDFRLIKCSSRFNHVTLEGSIFRLSIAFLTLVNPRLYAAKTNAIAFIEVQKEFGRFSTYLWQFMDHKPLNNAPKSMADIPAVTNLALVLSKDLKKRGFKFLGPTVMYAHMQASGMVNDHLTTCPRYAEIIEQTKGQKYGL